MNANPDTVGEYRQVYSPIWHVSPDFNYGQADTHINLSDEEK